MALSNPMSVSRIDEVDGSSGVRRFGPRVGHPARLGRLSVLVATFLVAVSSSFGLIEGSGQPAGATVIRFATVTKTVSSVRGTKSPTAPSAPKGVAAAAGNDQATVSWKAPAWNGGSPITGYVADSSPGSLSCAVTVTSCTVSGLTDGTTYTFKVTAVNAVGSSPASASSAAVTPNAPATPPITTPATPPITTPATTTTSSFASEIGIYVDGQSPASEAAQLGISKFPFYMDFVDGETNSTMIAPNAPDATDIANEATAAGSRLIAPFNMLPNSGVTAAQAVAGAMNATATTFAEQLVAAGQANAIIRLGWEMNGGWFPWGTENMSPAQFLAIWNQEVTSMKAVPGQHFLFFWNPSADPNNTCSQWLPPAGEVDVVGLDLYDGTAGPYPGPQAAWQSYLDEPCGLNYIASVAQARGIQIGFGEWGLGFSGGVGGDDPYFVTQFAQWCESEPVLFASLWNNGNNFFDGSNPKSVAALATLLSGISAPATAPGAPTGVTASAGNGSATVSWSAPASTGGSPVTGYTVTSTPAGATCTTAATSCTLVGLTNGTSYTFTVLATNVIGSGSPSAASAPMVPALPAGATITAVGSLVTAAGTTLTVSPASLGDVIVLSTETWNEVATVASVTGGGVTTWTEISSAYDTTSTGNSESLWYGTVTSLGTSTISVNYTGGSSGSWPSASAQEFTNGTGASTVWTVDVAGTSDNTTASTSVTFPTLTAATPNELYVGYAFSTGTTAAGTNAGYVYQSDVWGGSFIYDTAVTGTTAPTSGGSKNSSLALGVLLSA